MTARPSARHAYVEAEVVTALAHQVRALRQQRGWSQRDLARRLGTTQAVVSRLEDPSYGKATLQTLLQVAHAFDVGLNVRFESLVRMLQRTFIPRTADDEIPPFEDEAAHVGFAERAPIAVYTFAATPQSLASEAFVFALGDTVGVTPTATRAPIVTLTA